MELPFLQTLLASFEVVPLVVGNTTPQEVAHVLRRLWGGPETLIVVSSDLSHYHDTEAAQRLDAATATATHRGYGRLHATNATIENVQTASTKPNERMKVLEEEIDQLQRVEEVLTRFSHTIE